MNPKVRPSARLVLILLVVAMLGYSSSGANVTSAVAHNAGGATQRATTDIAGAYNVAGTNEDGSAYKGELAVIKHGDVYQFRWQVGQQYDGIGIGNGRVVAVAFTNGSNGKGCGVVNYRILADGTLDGNWGYWGTDEMGTERATHTRGAGVTGDYAATGSNPDGSKYKAALSVTSRASGYEFAWSNGSSGFGVRQGNSLSVGIGGSACAFVAYEIKSDGTLDGIWGGNGSDKTGTERATRKR